MMKEMISKEAWLKFNDPTFGSDNTELDKKARECMTTDQIWETLKRIDASLEGNDH